MLLISSKTLNHSSLTIMKSESEFSKFAKPRLEFFWTVESFEAGGNVSTPDWYLVHPTLGYSIWIELKIVKNGRITFQPGQVKWLEHHENKGGVAFVLLLSPNERGGEDVVGLFPAGRSRWLSVVNVKGKEELGKLLSLSLTNPLPLSSPALWESLAKELVRASGRADTRREATRKANDGYDRGKG